MRRVSRKDNSIVRLASRPNWLASVSTSLLQSATSCRSASRELCRWNGCNTRQNVSNGLREYFGQRGRLRWDVGCPLVARDRSLVEHQRQIAAVGKQAAVPVPVIDKGIPSTGLLASVLVAKYADQLLHPLGAQVRTRVGRSERPDSSMKTISRPWAAYFLERGPNLALPGQHRLFVARDRSALRLLRAESQGAQ
ncbi:hypothetical protein OKW49_008272 [Paraburkholderia youngii]